MDIEYDTDLSENIAITDDAQMAYEQAALDDNLQPDGAVQDIATDALQTETKGVQAPLEEGAIAPSPNLPFLDARATMLVEGIESLFNAAVIIISDQMEVSYYNQLALDLFEVPQRLIGTKIDMRDVFSFMAERGDFGPGDPETFVGLLDAIRGNPSLIDADVQKSYLTMPSGKILRVKAVRNTDGSYLITGHDMSIAKKKTDILNMAMNLSSSGYWIFDKHGTAIEVHSEYLKTIMTYRELQSIEETGLWSLFHADDLPRAEQLWKSVTGEGISHEGTVRITTSRHGMRWMRFNLNIQVNENGERTGVICFFTDVTDNLRQQENLRQAKQTAEDSLATKNDFLARMSHEIRTPMNGVIGIADALIHYDATPTSKPKLELIQSSANNILKILDETLDHTKLGSQNFTLNPAPANPAKVVRDVCSLWEQQALKNGGFIRCIIKPNVPDEVVFDRYRYEQCVNNLLSNAVKFTPKGQIDVVLTTVEKEGRSPRLVLAIRDTGIGMTAEQQANIFEAYSQGDKSISSRYGGTGLGLNITKQIVELMGGSITVKSEIGKGSIFALSFPLDEARAANQPHDVTPQQSQDSHSLVSQMLDAAKPEPSAYADLRILVVDDNATNHLVINSLLGSLVAEIHTANNGQEALDILDVTDIDIVLMDIHMPIMDGIEATISIRSSEKSWKDVKIIALTADPQYQQKKLCLNIGMDEALAKPVKLNDVLEAIDNVIPQAVEMQARQNAA